MHTISKPLSGRKPLCQLLLSLGVMSTASCGFWLAPEQVPERLQLARPQSYEVTFHTDSKLNTQRSSTRPAPLKMRLFHLHRQEEFLNSDFFSLQNEPATVLGDSLKSSEEFFLLPGQPPREVSFEAPPGARYLGVLGEFQDLEANTWRLVLNLPRAMLADEAGASVKLGQVYVGAGGIRLGRCVSGSLSC